MFTYNEWYKDPEATKRFIEAAKLQPHPNQKEDKMRYGVITKEISPEDMKEEGYSKMMRIPSMGDVFLFSQVDYDSDSGLDYYDDVDILNSGTIPTTWAIEISKQTHDKLVFTNTPTSPIHPELEELYNKYDWYDNNAMKDLLECLTKLLEENK